MTRRGKTAAPCPVTWWVMTTVSATAFPAGTRQDERLRHEGGVELGEHVGRIGHHRAHEVGRVGRSTRSPAAPSTVVCTARRRRRPARTRRGPARRSGCSARSPPRSWARRAPRSARRPRARRSTSQAGPPSAGEVSGEGGHGRQFYHRRRGNSDGPAGRLRGRPPRAQPRRKGFQPFFRCLASTSARISGPTALMMSSASSSTAAAEPSSQPGRLVGRERGDQACRGPSSRRPADARSPGRGRGSATARRGRGRGCTSAPSRRWRRCGSRSSCTPRASASPHSGPRAIAHGRRLSRPSPPSAARSGGSTRPRTPSAACG